MPEPGATIMAMPVSSNERTRVFPAAPGPHPALAVPQSSCSASGSAEMSALQSTHTYATISMLAQGPVALSGFHGNYRRSSSEYVHALGGLGASCPIYGLIWRDMPVIRSCRPDASGAEPSSLRVTDSLGT